MSSPVTRTRRSPRNHHTDIVNTTEQIKKKRRVSIPSSSVAKTEKVKTEKVKTEKVKTEKAKAARVKTERDSTCIPPPNWQIVYDTLESFREITKAPVDTMGCERLADPTASPKDQRFQTLIALMLSSQTKDTVTSVAVRKLQNELEGGLTLETILAIDETRLDQFIKTVGFHAKKASYIKRAAEILRDQYAGDIPDTIEGLTSLPGVGPKMGYLTLQVAWNMNLGIGVDVHVHRICNRLGWVKTNTPEETRMSLQSWLPKDKWRKINTIMVGFGQLICLPRGPQCETCPVKQYCPSAEIKKVIKKQKKEATTSVYFKQEPVNSALDW